MAVYRSIGVPKNLSRNPRLLGHFHLPNHPIPTTSTFQSAMPLCILLQTSGLKTSICTRSADVLVNTFFLNPPTTSPSAVDFEQTSSISSIHTLSSIPPSHPPKITSPYPASHLCHLTGCNISNPAPYHVWAYHTSASPIYIGPNSLLTCRHVCIRPKHD